jgi:hypothetical protein
MSVELPARLDVLYQNVLAIEAYLVQLAAAVADTKRQIDELRADGPLYGPASADDRRKE